MGKIAMFVAAGIASAAATTIVLIAWDMVKTEPGFYNPNSH